MTHHSEVASIGCWNVNRIGHLTYSDGFFKLDCYCFKVKGLRLPLAQLADHQIIPHDEWGTYLWTICPEWLPCWELNSQSSDHASNSLITESQWQLTLTLNSLYIFVQVLRLLRRIVDVTLCLLNCLLIYRFDLWICWEVVFVWCQKKIYKDQVELMMINHVFPEFISEHRYLRGRVSTHCC